MIPPAIFDASLLLAWSGWCLFGGITLINFFFADRLEEQTGPLPQGLRLSILMPARNEIENLRRNLPLWEAAVRQFKDSNPGSFIEMILLDDQSDDHTWVYAHDFFSKSGLHGRAIRSETPPPAGWVGKNWACHQLRKLALGDWLLFVDADVEPGLFSVNKSLETALHLSTDALSALPRQRMRTFAESAVIPWIMHTSILSLLPLPWVLRSPHPALSVVNGQWFLVRATVLDRIGGHESVRSSVLEDVHLGRRLKRAEFKVATVLATRDISVRMYQGWLEVRRGFGKNLYPLAGGSAKSFGIVAGGFAFFSMSPLLLGDPGLLILATGVLALQYRVFRVPLWQILPIWLAGTILVPALMIDSARQHRRGAVPWKNRVFDPNCRD